MSTQVTSTHHKLHDYSNTCTRHPWVPLLARFLRERRSTSGSVQAALPLLLILYLLANRRSGRVLVTKQTLAEVLNVETNVVDNQLRELEQLGDIAIKNSNSFLVLFIRSWPNMTERNVPSQTVTKAKSADSALQGSVSENNSGSSAGTDQQISADTESGDGVRGPERGEEDWLARFVDRLVAVVGAPHERPSYTAFCRKYPRDILEAALNRVEKTPQDQIRKSRGAFFTFLVKTISREKQNT